MIEDMWEKHMSAEEPSELCWNEVVGIQSMDDHYKIAELEQQIKELTYNKNAVESIRENYGLLISEHRWLIGAETVLDMIDAALIPDQGED